ncbi:hypothetical protein Pyrde_0262 [Pyrodictium delaneyi]|uniref:Uncharacterized protein n=1 Tax=Pyrodictium delaneyi TaxID=1273541 RepID=A0A0P0N201_9CREN|nr:hypothetical protein [Pyrodictium delaneyi]ALL00312.1 hypothetical protein Pyrde_0262 [Pyrodictium delaneyi]OWJ54378.1 hypothetical protein Pdsh_07855 [Pyrodictium delaneyi]
MKVRTSLVGAITLIAILALVASATPAAASEALLRDHPTVCYGCHSANITDTTVGPHDVKAAENAWFYCLTCHSSANNTGLWSGSIWGTNYGEPAPAAGDYVPNSVHGQIGCKCHTIVHAGFNINPTVGAGVWMYYYLPTVNGGAAAPNPNDLVKYVTFYNGTGFYTNDTSTATVTSTTLQLYYDTGTSAVPVDPTNMTDAKVYVGWFYINGSAPSGVSERFYICFNCHFLVESPAGLGMYKIENGIVKIGIPAEALQLNPHAITEDALQQLLSSGEEGFAIEGFPVAAAGINILASLVLFAIVLSRKK